MRCVREHFVMFVESLGTLDKVDPESLEVMKTNLFTKLFKYVFLLVNPLCSFFGLTYKPGL